MPRHVGDDIAFDTSIDKIASANTIAVRLWSVGHLTVVRHVRARRVHTAIAILQHAAQHAEGQQFAVYALDIGIAEHYAQQTDAGT